MKNRVGWVGLFLNIFIPLPVLNECVLCTTFDQINRIVIFVFIFVFIFFLFF